MLPELTRGLQNPKNFAFGLNSKQVIYDEISEIQRLEGHQTKSILDSEHGGMNKRKRGMHTVIHGGVFKPSDIERNSVLSLIQDSNRKLAPVVFSP